MQSTFADTILPPGLRLREVLKLRPGLSLLRFLRIFALLRFLRFFALLRFLPIFALAGRNMRLSLIIVLNLHGLYSLQSGCARLSDLSN